MLGRAHVMQRANRAWPGMGLDGMEAPGLYNSDKNPWQAYWHIAKLLAYSSI